MHVWKSSFCWTFKLNYFWSFWKSKKKNNCKLGWWFIKCTLKDKPTPTFLQHNNDTFQATRKSNENEVSNDIRDKHTKRKPNFKRENVERKSLLHTVFLWERYYKLDIWTLYKNRRRDDTVPSYFLESFRERYNEALLEEDNIKKNIGWQTR